MRLTIAAVGRLRAGPEKTLYDDYVGRLPWPVTLKEIEERRKLSTPQRKAREAELLLKALPEGATGRGIVIALDRRGKALDSEALARAIGGWRDGGARDLAFLIGGAEGLGLAVLERADLVLSMGAMTWPHLLARVMLAEQLYRAAAILSGHPYHRG
jgi:23S rRNA (pseudouridine1915-N3)-methyltransferase